MAIGDLITAADYNTIRNKIIGVIGAGVGNSGYGQEIRSLSVSSGSIVTKNQWDLLRFDIYNAIIHQTGSVPPINEVLQNDVIRYGAGRPVFQYETLSDQAITNRFDIGTGRFAVEAGSTETRTTAWTTSVTCTATITFGTTDQARYFFNSGGKMFFSSTRTGGTATGQNTSWSNLLSAAGVQVFDSVNSLINFYNLTNAFQVLYVTTSSVPYASNTYRIEVRGDIADNSNAGARIITVRVTWEDPYVDPYPESPPPDQVDGSLSLIIDQHRATGSLLPSGNFTVASPTYSISQIIGT
jgi:hypothetical protein